MVAAARTAAGRALSFPAGRLGCSALAHAAAHTQCRVLLPVPRCVRPDESSLTNRCHYLADGTVVFALTIRRAGGRCHFLLSSFFFLPF